jgi:hypothetical protein
VDRVRDYAVRLYDRADGNGVNWRTIAELFFSAGFQVLATKLAPDQKADLARLIHQLAYDHISGGPAASKTGAAEPESAPSNTDDLQSSPPVPPKLVH